jgi:hypothetical protein
MDITTSMSDGQDNVRSPAWDTGKAWEEYQSARMAGDAEAELLAMRRWGEAQTNASIGLVGQVVRPLAEQIAALAAQLKNSDFARLERNSQFQNELNTRLDGHALVLDEDIKRLAASVEGVAQLAGKALRLAEEVQAGQSELKGQVSNQGEKLDALVGRVEMVEVTPGTYPDLLRGMQNLEKAVTDISRRSDRRQLYLLISIGSIILLFAVLVALQIAHS